MVYTGKIFSYVGFEAIHQGMLPLHFAQPRLRLVGTFMHTPARPACVAMVYKPFFPDRIQNRYQCMLHNPIPEGQSGDQSPLRLQHIKRSVFPRPVLTPYQFILQLYQFSFQVPLKQQDIGSLPLTYACPQVSLMQPVELIYLLKQIPICFQEDSFLNISGNIFLSFPISSSVQR